jgi:hypothetical protein
VRAHLIGMCGLHDSISDGEPRRLTCLGLCCPTDDVAARLPRSLRVPFMLRKNDVVLGERNSVAKLNDTERKDLLKWMQVTPEYLLFLDLWKKKKASSRKRKYRTGRGTHSEPTKEDLHQRLGRGPTVENAADWKPDIESEPLNRYEMALLGDLTTVPTQARSYNNIKV